MQSIVHYMMRSIVLLSVCFSVAGAQPAKIISPNGGEVYALGDTIWIQWETQLEILPQVNVEISFDSGDTFTKIMGINYAAEQWGNLPYVLPDSAQGQSYLSEHCMVGVFSYFNRDDHDVSDNTFSIVNQLPPGLGDGLDKTDQENGTGCGSGASLAILPPLLFAGGGCYKKRRKKKG